MTLQNLPVSQMYYYDWVENFPMYTFRKPSGIKPSLTCNA